MSDKDNWEVFDTMLVQLRTVEETLVDCGKTCHEAGAQVIAGMLAGALVIVGEVCTFMEDKKKAESETEEEEQPS